MSSESEIVYKNFFPDFTLEKPEKKTKKSV